MHVLYREGARVNSFFHVKKEITTCTQHMGCAARDRHRAFGRERAVNNSLFDS